MNSNVYVAPSASLFDGDESSKESKVLNDIETMSYSYYHKNVKGKTTDKKKGYVCGICGYVLEADTLPEDYVCPLCLHGAEYFEELK